MLNEFPPEVPCAPQIKRPAELVGFDSEGSPSPASPPDADASPPSGARAASSIFASVSAAKSLRALVSRHDSIAKGPSPFSIRVDAARKAWRPLTAFAGGVGLAIVLGAALQRDSQSVLPLTHSNIVLPAEGEAKRPEFDALADREVDRAPAKPQSQTARLQRTTEQRARATATSGRSERVIARSGAPPAVSSRPTPRAINPDPPEPPVIAADRPDEPAAFPAVPPAAASAAAVVDAPPPIVSDEGAVRSVLERYRGAYERLDAYAAKTIWPSLDEDRLARAFSGLDSQSMVFDNCRINVSSARGIASCSGRMTYVARVGSKSARTQAGTWTFQLQKDGEGWTIDSVRAR